MPTLSVIIATYNRKCTLRKALEAYERQESRKNLLELLVVDDGSDDGTAVMVNEWALRSPLNARYLRQEKQGAAAARNFGIREAKGDVILFTDDDVIPSSNLIMEHAAWHSEFPKQEIAILGCTIWDQYVKPTPFMNWLGDGGPMLSFRGLVSGQEVDFRHFYTGNISLKTIFLREKGMFDEDFDTYGYEDIELGFRLQKAGIRLLYNADAIGFHHKFVTFTDACRRTESVAKSWEVFRAKEAGACLSRLADESPPSKMRRFLRASLKRAEPVFAPLTPLLDSYVPLPRFVYRALLRYHSER
ncbi:MAG TPA: glycosyltransferase [Terriglobia bacterium]|nr:glycosyltransferase [Terriglobia bacterium]